VTSHGDVLGLLDNEVQKSTTIQGVKEKMVGCLKWALKADVDLSSIIQLDFLSN
jgi:hypothetical protein